MFKVITLVVVCVLLFSPAHAYLDPGTGGFLLQILFGGVAGALVIIKIFWYKLKGFLGVKSSLPGHSEKSQRADKDRSDNEG